ncbi:MAG: hypothetical protein WCY19_05080 [Candidatus Gastranaerophilaceae bacterium]
MVKRFEGLITITQIAEKTNISRLTALSIVCRSDFEKFRAKGTIKNVFYNFPGFWKEFNLILDIKKKKMGLFNKCRKTNNEI